MVNIDWGNEDRNLLVWRVVSSWSTNESNEAWKIILRTLAESKPISLIIDLRQCLAPTTFILHLQVQMDTQMPANLPIIAVITVPGALDLLSNANRHPSLMQIVTEVDEAYALVDSEDAEV